MGNEKHSSNWLKPLVMVGVPVAFLVGIVVASLVLEVGWVEFVDLWGIPIGAALLVIVLFLQNGKSTQPSRLRELEKALELQGHPKVDFQFLSSRLARGKTIIFHAPMPSTLTLTDRLLHELSIPALVWLSKSALHRNVQRKLTLAFICIFFAASLVLVHWMPFEVALVVLIGSGVLLVALMGVVDLLLTQAADRAVTKTNNDRAGAKEALSFLYFVPLGWSLLLFPLHRFRVRKRARALLIDLEEGYRADVSDA
jgi:hypothetical protein